MAKSFSKLKQDLADLKNRLRQAETHEALKIGRLAVNEGLADLNISDQEWRDAFRDIAARFQGSAKNTLGKLKAMQHRAEAGLRQMTAAARKQDTRQKIELAGSSSKLACAIATRPSSMPALPSAWRIQAKANVSHAKGENCLPGSETDDLKPHNRICVDVFRHRCRHKKNTTRAVTEAIFLAHGTYTRRS